MADNGNGKNGDGKNGKLSTLLSHLLTGGGAVGAGVGGSVYLMDYKIQEAQKDIEKLQAQQTQLVQTTDEAKNNEQRIKSLERQLSYLLMRTPPTPSDPHGAAVTLP